MCGECIFVGGWRMHDNHASVRFPCKREVAVRYTKVVSLCWQTRAGVATGCECLVNLCGCSVISCDIALIVREHIVNAVPVR